MSCPGADGPGRPPKRPRVLVGVCTFNEAENVTPLLRRITAAVPAADVLVVDDDSPDGTAQRVRDFARQQAATAAPAGSDPPGQIAVHVRRGVRGLGGAIRAAMQQAIEGHYDLFCNLDADLSHDPADLPRLIQAIGPPETPGPTGGASESSRRVDVAVGSRYAPGGKIIGWPPHRRLMSGALNGFTRRLLRLPVRDASGSYRCYRVDTLAHLPPRASASDGYAFLQEVLLDLHRAGATCVEVPITFVDRESGRSKLDFREATRSLRTIVSLLRR